MHFVVSFRIFFASSDAGAKLLYLTFHKMPSQSRRNARQQFARSAKFIVSGFRKRCNDAEDAVNGQFYLAENNSCVVRGITPTRSLPQTMPKFCQ